MMEQIKNAYAVLLEVAPTYCVLHSLVVKQHSETCLCNFVMILWHLKAGGQTCCP